MEQLNADNTTEVIDKEADPNLFSDVEPQSLNLEPRVLSALINKMKIQKLTKIQADTYQPILEGKDVLMRADTGSGKTLAYLIPIMQRLVLDFPKDTNPITRDMGPLVCIIAPTRELCVQIETVVLLFKSQMPFLCPGTLLGGEGVQSEKKRIRKGINILIATPGRMLYHFQNSTNFTFPNLRYLVLDEADRLLDMGFMGRITEILNLLPPRQTCLCSATLHKELSTLTQLALKSPVTVGIMESEDFSIPETLVQRYVVVPTKQRLTFLTLFLKQMIYNYPDMKAIVYLSNCSSVDFHYAFFNYFNFVPLYKRQKGRRITSQPLNKPPPSELLKVIVPQKTEKAERKLRKYGNPEEQNTNQDQPKKPELVSLGIRDPHASTDNDEIVADSPYLECPIFRIHGNIDQITRSKTIAHFTAAPAAVLFCTDVAARGLDITGVNTIVQYDPPIDTEDYVHRAGRAGRIGKDGIAFLILQDYEIGFIDLLQSKGVEIKRTTDQSIYQRALEALQGDNLELCVASHHQEIRSTIQNNDLEMIAAHAWASTIAAYSTHKPETRAIFTKNKLHLGQLAEAFGISKPPSEIKEMLREEREQKEATEKSKKAEDVKMLPSFEERTSEFL